MEPTATETAFVEFCTRLLGGVPDNGAMFAHARDMFYSLYPELNPAQDVGAAKVEFVDAIYSVPFICYMIRCKATKRAYIGRTDNGFRERYNGDGSWWNGHHNPLLNEDLLRYGVAGFSVSVWQCEDHDGTVELERTLIKTHSHFTYNLAMQPDNETDGGDRFYVAPKVLPWSAAEHIGT